MILKMYPFKNCHTEARWGTGIFILYLYYAKLNKKILKNRWFTLC